jgi:hypothetical protein
MTAISRLSKVAGVTAVGTVLAVLILASAVPLLQTAYAANDNNDENNLRCTGNPHDPQDQGNAHEPPNSSANPHFCPPIG